MSIGPFSEFEYGMIRDHRSHSISEVGRSPAVNIAKENLQCLLILERAVDQYEMLAIAVFGPIINLFVV
jgi:hypothetical protein